MHRPTIPPTLTSVPGAIVIGLTSLAIACAREAPTTPADVAAGAAECWYPGYPPDSCPPSPQPVTPQPTERPARLHADIAGLPSDWQPRIEQAFAGWWTGYGALVHLVPISAAGGRLDLAAVISDADSSRLVWRLGAPSGLAAAWRSFREQPVNDYRGVLAASDQGAVLVALDWDGVLHIPVRGTPRVAAALVLGDTRLDRDPAVLHEFENALPGTPAWYLNGALYATHVDELGREVFRLRGEHQLVDLQGDGTVDVLEPADSGWKVLEWRDGSYQPVRTVQSDSVADPQTVDPDSLPVLPADLYFVRGQQLWRWPRSGGHLQLISTPRKLVVSELAVSAVAGQYPRTAGVLGYVISASGGHIAWAEFGELEGGGLVEPSMHSIDLLTGQESEIKLPSIEGYSRISNFDLSPDGQYVALELGPMSDDPNRGDEGVIATMPLSGQGEARLIARCRHGVTPNGGRFGCGPMRLSPDGRLLAYTDFGGLWIADLTNGTTRMIQEHQIAPVLSPGDLIYGPLDWAADSRRLLASVGEYEGSRLAYCDFNGCSLVVDTGTYATTRSEAAWSPRSDALIHAQVAGRNALAAYDPRSGTDRPVLDAIGHDAISPRVAADGSILFGLQTWGTAAYRGNGVFSIRADGTDWRQIAPLRSLGDDDVSDDYSHGHLLWSPDASVFLFVDTRPADGGTQPFGHTIGLTDGSGLWDVRTVLRNGVAFQWSPH